MEKKTLNWIAVVGVVSLGMIEVYDMFNKDRTEIIQRFEGRLTKTGEDVKDNTRRIVEIRRVLCRQEAHAFCGE